MRNIAYIERQLRNGKTPEDLGAKPIGKGVSKTAYLLELGVNIVGETASIVIKEDIASGFESVRSRPPKGIAKFGAKLVKQYRAGKWAIQEPVTVLHDAMKAGIASPELVSQWEVMYYAGLGDLHEYNCGIDKRGRLVVFDW